MSSFIPRSGKFDLKPKRHHAYTVLLFLLGTLFPPLAVGARFGIGKDFWLNLLLTICGYIPGHVHNFYIQNIRNNKNNQRTPKWAQRYGLVDTSGIRRKAKKSEWASKYNDRLPNSTLEGQEFEEGQTVDTVRRDSEEGVPPRTGQYWGPEDERYYRQNGDAGSTRSEDSGGRWRYPANFDDAIPMPSASKKKKKKVKKDRWARTEDAYSLPDDGKKKKKKKKSKSAAGDADSYDRRSDSTVDFPEDPEGGLHRERFENSVSNPTVPVDGNRDVFEHEF